MKHSQKKFIKAIVADAVSILLKEAEGNFQAYPERTKRYVKMVWSLIKKNNFRLTREQKLKFCKKCFSFWIVDKSAKIDFDQHNSMFEITCMDCGYKKRFK